MTGIDVKILVQQSAGSMLTANLSLGFSVYMIGSLYFISFCLKLTELRAVALWSQIVFSAWYLTVR